MSNTILLISPTGENLGNHDLETAQRIADERFGLDLVEVRPGTYKILDMGKLAYEASKRKQVKHKPAKEMKFTLNIGDHDFDTKIKHVNKFLNAGHTVKVTIWFSGREVSRPQAGVEMIQKVAAYVDGVVTSNYELLGKNMYATVEPRKK